MYTHGVRRIYYDGLCTHGVRYAYYDDIGAYGMMAHVYMA